MNAPETSKRLAIPIDDHQATSDNGLREDHDGRQQQRNRDTRDADAIAEHDEGGAVGGQRRAVEQPLNPPLRNSLEDQLPDLTSTVDLFARLKQAQKQRTGLPQPQKEE